MSNPKLTTCAAEMAVDFKRNWKRQALALNAGESEPPLEVVVATLYSLLYSGKIICPKPEHRIGISLRDKEPEAEALRDQAWREMVALGDELQGEPEPEPDPDFLSGGKDYLR